MQVDAALHLGLTTLADALPDLAERPLTVQVWLAETLRRDRAWLLAHTDAELTTEQTDRYTAGLARLATGEPLPYVLGYRDFYGRRFAVSPAVLIPRPETEHLIDAALTYARRQPDPLRIIDIGTGSGCIALTLALELPTATVCATDTSAEALTLAHENAAAFDLSGRVQLLPGDLFAETSGVFDIICSNPPYIATAELAGLAVARHEPLAALDGGPDGLHVIRRILHTAREHLRPGGLLLIEIGAGQAEAVGALAAHLYPAARFHFDPDLAGHPRLLVLLQADYTETPPND